MAAKKLDHVAALREGWVMQDDGSLERRDDPPTFRDDAHAVCFVLARALAGSSNHVQALKKINPSWLLSLSTKWL